MTSVSKNVYINDLADIVNKYNNTYHSTINVKPVNEKSSVCIDFNVEISDEDPKFDHVPISKYNRIFAKDFTANLSEEIFIIKKLKTPGRGHMILVILMVKNYWEVLQKRIAKAKSKRV